MRLSTTTNHAFNGKSRTVDMKGFVLTHQTTTRQKRLRKMADVFYQRLKTYPILLSNSLCLKLVNFGLDARRRKLNEFPS